MQTASYSYLLDVTVTETGIWGLFRVSGGNESAPSLPQGTVNCLLDSLALKNLRFSCTPELLLLCKPSCNACKISGMAEEPITDHQLLSLLWKAHYFYFTGGKQRKNWLENYSSWTISSSWHKSRKDHLKQQIPYSSTWPELGNVEAGKMERC